MNESRLAEINNELASLNIKAAELRAERNSLQNKKSTRRDCDTNQANNKELVRRLLDEGVSIKDVARTLRIPTTKVRKLLFAIERDERKKDPVSSLSVRTSEFIHLTYGAVTRETILLASANPSVVLRGCGQRPLKEINAAVALILEATQ